MRPYRGGMRARLLTLCVATATMLALVAGPAEAARRSVGDTVGDAPARLDITRLTLTEGVPRTGLVMAKLHRADDGWRLHAIGRGISVTVPTEGVEALRPFL